MQEGDMLTRRHRDDSKTENPKSTYLLGFLKLGY